MAAAPPLSVQGSGHSICLNTVAGLALGSLPLKTCQPAIRDMRNLQQKLCIKRRAEKKPYTDNRLHLVMSAISSSDIRFNPLTPSDTIKQFYTCINEKNLKQLSNFISSNCLFDDCSFPKPFQGKEEVMCFFEQLITSMGQNLEFNIGLICEGDDLTAGVTWHLEWKKKQIPLTRGCSFCECSIEGSRLVIKKAQVIIESPFKAGALVLTLLKFVTSIFDEFPQATEWFLNSPHVILQLFLRIYSIVLWPFISPLLGFYINLWNFMARLFSYTIKILFYISKIFYK
ncbi:hypothetical protein F0562_013198 [Nyssa sinensis]|uniref:SnoaL-like domain-containing protein n=1 Tax=Nyssa sinensis TaxID=561372 RepID=A0A5J4ZZD9_9ASTE|nr:hypothetical protein F0562_013198 [Nyssa sinensis]